MGAWAQRNVPHLSEADLRAYEAILGRETLDIYNIITGTGGAPPPPELAGPVLDSIRAFVRASPLGKASVQVRRREGLPVCCDACLAYYTCPSASCTRAAAFRTCTVCRLLMPPARTVAGLRTSQERHVQLMWAPGGAQPSPRHRYAHAA